MSQRSEISAAPVTERVRFDLIRYAQVWEDADTLLPALRISSDDVVVSVASAGDNVLALLTADPKRVVAYDISAAQLECLRLRICAFRSLSHEELLELSGSSKSGRRQALLDRVLAEAEPNTAEFWDHRRDDVNRYGFAGVGRFEGYLRTFRRWILPLVHSRRTVRGLLVPKDAVARCRYFDERWNSWRWRVLVATFFSRRVMGRLGRDPAFFDHVSESVSDHVARRTAHALTKLNPADNPYLSWILMGGHRGALPCYLRPENFRAIRARLERVEIRQGEIGGANWNEAADAYNLSDIFEYMDRDVFERVYDRIVSKARPGARLAHWNMLAPRGVPESCSLRVARNSCLGHRLHSQGQAFFYSDLVIGEVAL